MISRRLILLVAALAFALAAPAPSQAVPAAPPSAGQERQMTISVNGQQLAAQPAPRIVNGHVLVPIVRILSALGIPVSRQGPLLTIEAPSTPIRLQIGSSRAQAGNRTLSLETPPVEIGGTTYVPLRFVVDALGASVSYNPVASRIEIVSNNVRRDTPSQDLGSGKVKISGTLAALDLYSDPPAISVSYRGAVRTISINSTAKVVMQDVVARTQQNGTLNSLHAGDAIAVTMNKDGSVDTIQDMYGSRAGTIAAVSSTAIVLDNGRVVTPDRSTSISLNGQPANLGDLRVGDTVVQRTNPETGETREMIASRQGAAPAATPVAEGGAGQPATGVAVANPGGAVISGITVDPGRPLKLGESFRIAMQGTPGGKASFDVGTFFAGMPMQEESPGNYVGKLTVDAGMNFLLAPVFGNLVVGGVQAKTVEARFQISAATIAPQITEIAPANGQVVNNNRPSIYATYAAPTDLGISAASVSIKVNGSDVTTASTRTTSFVTYNANVSLPDGPVTVSVAVADLAGNSTQRSWTFTIRTR